MTPLPLFSEQWWPHMNTATTSALETYYAARAARGEGAPSFFHVSFNIGGRTVSDKVRGCMAAYAHLDLLVEQAEAEEFKRTRKVVLAHNCKVREIVEVDDLTRAIDHEVTVRGRIRRWGV